jgi:hypothetical protein
MKLFNAPPESWEQIHLIHETVYTYSAPVNFSPHRFVLRPREGHDIRLNTMTLSTFPASEISWYRDMLDNTIAIASIAETATELRIVSEFTVSVPPVDPAGQAPIFVPHPSVVAGINTSTRRKSPGCARGLRGRAWRRSPVRRRRSLMTWPS